LTLTRGYFGHADDTQNTVFCLFEPYAPGLAADSFPKDDAVFFGTRPGKRNCFLLPTVRQLTDQQMFREVTELRRLHTRGEDMDPEVIKRIVWEYKNVTDGPSLARVMNELAAKHPRTPGSDAGTPVLPVMADLRQALNVAAADPCGVIVVVHPSERDEALEQRLARLAFADPIAGRAYIARLTAPEWARAREIGQISGGSAAAGVYFVAPDPFGLDGEVWAGIAPDASEERLRTELTAVLDRFLREYKKQDRASHLMAGVANDISWTEYDPDFGGIVRIGPGSKKLGKYYDPAEREAAELESAER
jgi:hypothetical protein